MFMIEKVLLVSLVLNFLMFVFSVFIGQNFFMSNLIFLIFGVSLMILYFVCIMCFQIILFARKGYVSKGYLRFEKEFLELKEKDKNV